MLPGFLFSLGVSLVWVNVIKKMNAPFFPG